MKNLQVLALAIIVLFLFASCQQELLAPQGDDPTEQNPPQNNPTNGLPLADSPNDLEIVVAGIQNNSVVQENDRFQIEVVTNVQVDSVQLFVQDFSNAEVSQIAVRTEKIAPYIWDSQNGDEVLNTFGDKVVEVIVLVHFQAANLPGENLLALERVRLYVEGNQSKQFCNEQSEVILCSPMLRDIPENFEFVEEFDLTSTVSSFDNRFMNFGMQNTSPNPKFEYILETDAGEKLTIKLGLTEVEITDQNSGEVFEVVSILNISSFALFNIEGLPHLAVNTFDNRGDMLFATELDQFTKLTIKSSGLTYSNHLISTALN